MSISASVGNGGVNKPVDVITVQEYLCVARRQDGLPPIKVDGLVGPETIAAITLFEQTHTGIADGRVDPNGPAITALEGPFEDLLRGQIRTDGLNVMDISQTQLGALGLQLSPELSDIFDDVRQDVVAVGGAQIRLRRRWKWQT
jgi:peptidoglycan hydrolase-like protein with peptidoglycan-binding domain